MTEQQIWSEDSFWESFPQILKQGGCMMKTSKGIASFLCPSKPFPMTSHAWNPEFVWLSEENEITQCPERVNSCYLTLSHPVQHLSWNLGRVPCLLFPKPLSLSYPPRLSLSFHPFPLLASRPSSLGVGQPQALLGCYPPTAPLGSSAPGAERVELSEQKPSPPPQPAVERG